VFFSKSKNVVGLDIGSSAVKLVELKEKKGGTFQLVKLGIERVRPFGDHQEDHSSCDVAGRTG
jgi:type IV pilus assembly protein PilM